MPNLLTSNHTVEIGEALATPGGHLSIGRGGVTMFYGNCRHSGFVVEEIMNHCVAAGLPVIDTRHLPIKTVLHLVKCPMIAVNRDPDAEPYHSLSYAPLSYVAKLYAAAGAHVYNVT